MNMVPFWRTGGPVPREPAPRGPSQGESTPSRESSLGRDVALVCVADGLVGVSFGATTVAAHLPWWVPVAMSLLVFAGGSQFAAVGVVLAGGSPVAAVAAGAVLNTRLLPYGFAVADVVGSAERAGRADRADRDSVGQGDTDSARNRPARGHPGRTGPSGARSAGRRWLVRIVGAQVITDESTAFAMRQTDPARRRTAFWSCGLALFAVWNVSVLLGVLAGSAIRNTNAFGLDATFPAVLIALALPALDGLRTRLSAGAGAVIAVALTPVLPAGLPVLAALAGLGTGWRPRRRTSRRRASTNPMTRPHQTDVTAAARDASTANAEHGRQTSVRTATDPARNGTKANPAGPS
jgi:predicted branched-subunit amino acid permease